MFRVVGECNNLLPWWHFFLLSNQPCNCGGDWMDEWNKKPARIYLSKYSSIHFVFSSSDFSCLTKYAIIIRHMHMHNIRQIGEKRELFWDIGRCITSYWFGWVVGVLFFLGFVCWLCSQQPRKEEANFQNAIHNIKRNRTHCGSCIYCWKNNNRSFDMHGLHSELTESRPRSTRERKTNQHSNSAYRICCVLSNIKKKPYQSKAIFLVRGRWAETRRNIVALVIPIFRY